ncbi:MAG: undecaprenyl-diphosphatase UppP [Desulfobacterales bacterium]|jgi:undecaprenyl-diphosphatase|nr:undecaprenyl-diphosphatase UppP [Desulfobacterales bacterium]
MNSTEAIILGIIQGLTEFLPVSSSGHLVLFQQLFGLKEAELFFDVCVHLGTLVAVIIVFRQEIIKIISALLQLVSLAGQKEKFLQKVKSDPELKMAVFIVIGSIPTAILGLLFASIADRLFSSALITGLMLMVTGLLLWLTRKAGTHAVSTSIGHLTPGKAFIIGIVQGLAIIPGISRSGSTISTGLLLGVDRETAARYSFLLSIPAIVGAGLLSLKEGFSQTNPAIWISLLGAVPAALVGYGALKSLLHMVKKGRLYVFAPYCWLVGILAILFSW